MVELEALGWPREVQTNRELSRAEFRAAVEVQASVRQDTSYVNNDAAGEHNRCVETSGPFKIVNAP
jgi:hypothetical protein